ncbi:uncharacterized protein LOC141807632 isoform X2 [Halichoeres trimaculatus]|uniref:uncharacterized protein LOC141807632 isoform X2 n=1 Tax=Halichoeres trimaculatus TaxID=147232 RepID=UPI003D9E0439
METKYPTLKRPKRKLCYLTNPDSPVKKWTGKLCLADIENMFDDLDSPSTDEVDLIPPSPLQQTSSNEKKVSSTPREEIQRRPMDPKGDAPKLSSRSLRCIKAMASPAANLDIPFKGHGPIKTSSPIEENTVAGRGCKDLNKEQDKAVSPILFTCEGEEEEEAQREPAPCQKLQTNGHSTQKSDDFELESPPVKVALSKPKTSCHKKEVEGICKENQPIKHKTPRKPENGDMVGKRKTESQESKDPPVPAVRQKPEIKVHNRKPESVQKKPSADVFTRVGKDVTGFLQKLREAGQAKPACSRKSLSPVKVPTPPPEPEDDFWILEDETPLWISIPTKSATSKKQRQGSKSSTDKSSSIDKEAKEKVKGKEGENKKSEEAKSRNDTPELSNPEDPTDVHVPEKEKTNQKSRLKRVPSKEKDKAREKSEDVAISDKDEAQKPSEITKQKPSKDKKENVKRSRTKKVKEIREEGRGCDAGKKATYTEEAREENGGPEEMGFPSDEEVVKPEAQAEMGSADGNDEHNKAPPVSDGTSPTDDQILRKKRKKQHGPRRVSNQEETEVPDRQPTAKKSKPIKELNKVAPSPVDVKKEKVLKRKGDQVFQRVYHSTSAEKQSITPAPASPRRPMEQLSAGESKRRRKPPGNWWIVGSPTAEEDENLSPPPQPKEPKLQKERKKQSRPSKLGTPKNGNVAVSSKPQGGAPIPPLSVKPLSAPKTVKRSLATFKDIFTSNTETPTLQSNRGTGRTNTRKVTASDASVPDEGVREVLSAEPEEVISPPQHQALQDGTFPSVNSLKAHRSGPSSMIELQEYDEDDNSALVSGVHGTLSMSDLCAPPLKPLVLQPKDKANLTEWFKYLWSATVDSGPEITPDQFDWYFHQGRAIGFFVDLNCGTICNGKMLLGSYMKKPLWVDHSATSVFNLFTSSVSVTINGSESRYSPGQSFMVPCGQAYSIKNILGQPAMLCFTRILAESLD